MKNSFSQVAHSLSIRRRESLSLEDEVEFSKATIRQDRRASRRQEKEGGEGNAISGLEFRVPDFGSRVLELGSRFPGFRVRVSVFGSRISGFGFRAPTLARTCRC